MTRVGVAGIGEAVAVGATVGWVPEGDAVGVGGVPERVGDGVAVDSGWGEPNVNLPGSRLKIVSIIAFAESRTDSSARSEVTTRSMPATDSPRATMRKLCRTVPATREIQIA